MTPETNEFNPKILVLTTLACSDPGADNAGQKHLDYYPYSYVIRMPDPVVLPERTYYHAFASGFDGILIASCGEEDPYEGAYHSMAKRLDALLVEMKNKGISIERLKITAICTVCADAFVREVNQMAEKLKKLPPAREELKAAGITVS